MTALDTRFGYSIRDLTIGKLLASKAQRIPEKVFFHALDDDRRYSYRDVHRLSNRLAHALAAQGIGKGTHVAVVMDNSPELLLTYFALGKLGAVVVMVNTAARGMLLQYFLKQSDSTAVVCDQALLGRVLDACSEASLGAIASLVVLPDPAQGPVPPAPAGMRMADLVELLADPRYSQDDAPTQAVKHSDLAFISYTSGTTGPSKGVMFSHARALTGGINNAETFGHRFDDVLYTCMPMFHGNAMQGSVYVALVCDATVAFARRFSASRFWDDVRRSGATVTNLLGSMANFLWSQPPSTTDRDNRLRMVLNAPIPKFATQFEQRFGLRFISAYALTDFGTPTGYTLNDPPHKLGSAGRVRSAWQVRVVDDDDFPVPAGEPGEIVLRAEVPWYASLGYYKMPEKTLEALRNGWFHTGDRGYLDEDGYLWFVDRKKDSIRRRGENISAFEVEQVLLNHPAIADAAAYPLQSETSEDEVAVSLVCKPGARVAEAELVHYCVQNMSYFMVPRFIEFLPDLPRNLSQKVEKYKLRQTAEAGRERLWDREKAGVVVAR